MSEFLPTFSFALLALSLMFKLYSRSVSAFVAIALFTICSNLFHYGFGTIAEPIACLGMLLIMTRAMLKEEGDKALINPCDKCKYKLGSSCEL